MPRTGRKMPPLAAGKGRKVRCSFVQSLHFDKDKWTKERAINWLLKKNYFTDAFDESKNELRFKQFDHDETRAFRRKGFWSRRRGIRALYSIDRQCARKK